MNKKGDILVYPFLAGILLGLVLYYIIDVGKQPAYQTAYIGQTQLGMIKGDAELKKAMLYLDSAAKLSSGEALYFLGQNGGLVGTSACGALGTYSLWNNGNIDCFPDIISSANNALSFSIDSYLNNYDSLKFPQSNYRFYLRQVDDNALEIIGSALDNVNLKATNLGVGFTRLDWPTEKEYTTSAAKKFIVEFYDSMISKIVGGDLKYYIGECYGEREKHCDGCSTFNYGIDIPMYEKADVYAAADGKIIEAGEDEECGNYIIIDHSDTFQTMYCHLYENSVDADDEVKAGEKIGFVGDTGKAYGTYLNFRVKVNGLFVNPIPFFYHIDYNLNENSSPCKEIGTVSYSIKPSFKANLDYNISVYADLKIKANDLILRCSTSSLTGCIEDELNEPDYINWFGTDCKTKSITAVDKKAAFCVKEDKQFYVYDEHEKKADKRNVEIKFGLTFMDDAAPPAVENVVLEDAPNKENAVIVKWSENIDNDVALYKIYYSKEQFKMVNETGVKNISSVADDNDPDKNGYMAIVENFSDYNNDAPINSYWFGVTAEDFSGNENKTVSYVVKGDDLDDLAPMQPIITDTTKEGSNLRISWQHAAQNADGSAAYDVKAYRVYYSTSDFSSVNDASFLDTKAYSENSLLKQISLFSTGQKYYFAVTAVDEVPNENKAVAASSYTIS